MKPHLRLEFDPEFGNLHYIYLAENLNGVNIETHSMEDAAGNMVNLDIDQNTGILVGIELVGFKLVKE